MFKKADQSLKKSKIEKERLTKEENFAYEEIKKRWTVEAKDTSGVKDSVNLTKIKFTLYSPELLAAYYQVYKEERKELTEEELKKTTFFKYIVVAMEMETYKEEMYLDLDLWHFYLIDDLGNKYEVVKVKSSPIKKVTYQDEKGACFYQKAILFFPKRSSWTNELVMNRETKYLKVQAYGLLERINAFWRLK
ncbi:hypothetical protein KKB54_05350 [bacterium]|nr:hypothetical protein [bacterium]MBU0900222.1 hypothetical protein [bacterium]MBU2598965.1 hypothetical protein [bacterium]